MPPGDAQRAWFPEMIDIVRERWSPDLTWEECGDLFVEMTELRTQIRSQRNIRPSRYWCKNCEAYHDSVPPPISIRSLLFALKNADVISESAFKELDKSWKKHKKSHSLDTYGKKS